jgi:hypothetical protein
MTSKVREQALRSTTCQLSQQRILTEWAWKIRVRTHACVRGASLGSLRRRNCWNLQPEQHSEKALERLEPIARTLT